MSQRECLRYGKTTLAWSKIAFVTSFRGHSQNTNVIGQRELANWMQHPEMSNGCSAEVSTVPSAADIGQFGGGMGHRFAENPMLRRTLLRKSITSTHVHLRGKKSKLGLEA